MIINGTKLYKYEGDELKTYRIINFKDDIYTLKAITGKERLKLNEEEVNSSLIKLNPDAFMNIMSTTSKGPNGDIDDVFVCVNKATDMLKGKTVPSLIIRQNCLSNSKGALMNTMQIFVGDCFTDSNITGDMKMQDVMEFDNIDKTFSIALYIDDTEGDIFECIPNKIHDEFSVVLKKIKSANNNKLIVGFCTTLKELISENNFLLNYRYLFNILQLDFPIYIDNRSMDSEGNIILNKKQHKKLEDVLGQFIKVVAILKYDKDIDISKIVTMTHVIVSDKSGLIYLVAYQKIADYKVDDDIADALGIQQ